MEWERKEPVVVLHAGTNNVGRTRKEVLLRKLEQLGTKLNSRTTKAILSGLLPKPRANWHRVDEFRELNAWFND